jgi:hypothetical protein
MLSSLFGDLVGSKDGTRKGDPDRDDADHGFAATAILQSLITDIGEPGQAVDRHHHDLVVRGSPAQAIREHFATTRSDLETASRLITLLDPVGVWGAAVVKALSDAGGRPVERLHLREQTTLRTLATIERTTLVRRQEETLRIYHADVRVPGAQTAEIPVALMERSHMTTVIVGPMEPHALEALISALRNAAALSTWRCRHLLFMRPPGADWIDPRITDVAWPAGLKVHLLSEPLVSASSVWNAMLGTWNVVKDQRAAATVVPLRPNGSEYPIKVAELPLPSAADAPRLTRDLVTSLLPGLRGGRPAIDAARAQKALAGLLAIDGLTGCALVDATTGLVLLRESRDESPIDLDLWAVASAQLLRAHRTAARSVGLPDRIDEVTGSAGAWQQILRTLARHPEVYLLAVLDKHRANLALARFRLMEIEKGL